MKDRVEVTVTGTAYTQVLEGETEDQARNRLAGRLLQGEIKVNEIGDVRLHLSIGEPKEGEAANEFDHDNPLSRFKFVDEIRP